MASLVYKITGKHDDKGINDAGKSLEALGKKAAEISKRMATLPFLKTFEIAKGAIDTLVGNVDVLGRSISAIKKASTDIMTPVFSSVSEMLEKKLPEITANIVAAMNVTKDMIQSVVTGVSSIANKEGWTNFFTNITTLSHNFGNVLAKLLEIVFTNAPHFLINGFLKVIPAIKGIIDNIGIMLDTATRDMQINTLAQELAERRYRPGTGKSFDQVKQEAMDEATRTIDQRIKATLEKAGVTFPTGQALGSTDLHSALEELGKGLKETFFSFGDAVTGGGTADSFEKYKQEFLRSFNVKQGKEGGKSDNPDPGIEYNGDTLAKIMNDTFNNAVSRITESSDTMNSILKNVNTKGATELKKMMGSVDNAIDISKEKVDEYAKKIRLAVNDEEATKYYKAIQGELKLINTLTQGIENNIKNAQREQEKQAQKQTIIDSAKDATEIDDVVNGAMTGGPMGVIAALIGKIVGIFSQIENVGKVLNPFSTILERTAAILEPLLNELFAPFVIILESVGDIIGNILAPVFEVLIVVLHPILDVIVTILNILKPLSTLFNMIVSILFTTNPLLTVFSMALKVIADIIKLVYNKIFVPVGNGIIWIFTQIENAFVWLYNKISDVLRGITLGIVNLGNKSASSYEDRKLSEISNEPTDYSTGNQSNTGSSIGSASYTAARDVVINIYFNHSFINGDAESIAITLRDEILLAEAKGY